MENIKIAILDDSQQMKTMVSEFFENSEKYDLVLFSGNGANALEDIRSKRPDIVLLDLVLPNKDGLSVLQEMSKLPDMPKVIVTTALTNDNFVHKAMEAGAVDYIVKPFEKSLIEERIDLAVGVTENSEVREAQNKVNELIAGYRTRPVLKNRNLDERISNIFITVGIPAHIKGYQFLREAIKMAVDQPEIVNSITKKLYPNIAKVFETTPSKVERAIRHAIEVAWNRGKIENINDVFGLQVYGTNEKPTNGEFIALVADKMIIEGC